MYSYGISVIELLVAMALGVVLLNAIIRVYTSNHQASRMISGVSALQESSRVAINRLTHALRLTGQYGGVKGTEIANTAGINGVGNCDTDWITETTRPIEGYEGADNIASVVRSNAGGTEPFPAGCIEPTHYVPNSDIVVIRYGSYADATPTAAANPAKIYLRTSISSGIMGGEISSGADLSSSSIGVPLDGVGIYNYGYRTEVYFLRPCSELNGGACDDGVHTLMQYRIDGSDFIAEPIAEGVEQLQFEYGVDLEDESGATGLQDYVADTYQLANDVDDWAKVVSVRLSLVVRSEQMDANISDTNTYELVGGYNYTPSTDVAKYRRKIYTKVVQLRNMSRG